MPLPILPLAEKILLTKVVTHTVKLKSSEFAGVKSRAKDGVNTLRLITDIEYEPLTLADRTTLMAFLDSVNADVVFSYEPCSGGAYKVRRVVDTLKQTRYNGKYKVKFSLIEVT